jgi:outer membrane protein assembly factor BamB
MEDTGLAAPTAATDGRVVCAIFATGHAVCFDYDGREKWRCDLGMPDTAYGYASSLEIHQGLVFIQYDQGPVAEDEKSRLLAVDTLSGRIVWTMPRPVPNSWTSPVLVSTGIGNQLVTLGSPWIISYRPRDGSEIWRASCAEGDVAPSPVKAGPFVLAVKPYYTLTAVRPNGSGDVTSSHKAWVAEDNIPDICSPVSDGRFVFLLTSEGTLTCYRLEDGKKLWEKDLGATFRASPSMVGEKLCVLSDNGRFTVLAAEESCRVLSESEFGEACSASPAFAQGRMYVRTLSRLYCIGRSE